MGTVRDGVVDDLAPDDGVERVPDRTPDLLRTLYGAVQDGWQLRNKVDVSDDKRLVPYLPWLYQRVLAGAFVEWTLNVLVGGAAVIVACCVGALALSLLTGLYTDAVNIFLRAHHAGTLVPVAGIPSLALLLHVNKIERKWLDSVSWMHSNRVRNVWQQDPKDLPLVVDLCEGIDMIVRENSAFGRTVSLAKVVVRLKRGDVLELYLERRRKA